MGAGTGAQGEPGGTAHFRRGGAIAALALLGASPAAAQADFPEVRIGGRVHQQFYRFDGGAPGGEAASNFLIRRVRLTASGRIAEHVGFLVQTSLGGDQGGIRLGAAYVDLRLTPAGGPTSLHLRVGQEKHPLGRYELMSSGNLPSIERGAGDGLVPAAQNDLFSDAGFLSLDVGASARLTRRLGRATSLSLQAGIYNGQGASARDVNRAKSFGGRVELSRGRLALGGSWFRHDFVRVDTVAPGPDPVVTTDSAAFHDAWNVDAQWGAAGEPGPLLVLDYMAGRDRTAAGRRMRGMSLIGAWHLRPGRALPWLHAVEPALRLDLADPDRATPDDAATLLTVVAGAYLSPDVQLRLAYERQTIQGASRPGVDGIRSAVTVDF